VISEIIGTRVRRKADAIKGTTGTEQSLNTCQLADSQANDDAQTIVTFTQFWLARFRIGR
jgi:hypothetical protein